MREATIRDIERINCFVLVLGSIASIVVMRDFKYFFSFAVASAIMTLNFRFLGRIIKNAFGGPSIKKTELAIGLPIKFLALVGLVVLAVVFGNIDPIFFVVGLSTVFIALLINQISIAFKPDRRKEDGA
jgi:hypothetical protein